MTLQDLGNIGEFVAAIGVIASLVYLAVQIRQNTRAVRSNTSQAITDARVEFLKSITDNAEVARIVRSGLSSRQSLEGDDRMRFDVMMNRLMAMMENYYYQRRQGTMEAEQWARAVDVLRWFMSSPGGQSWWSSRLRIRPDVPFERFLDEEVEAIQSGSTDMSGNASTPATERPAASKRPHA